MAPIRRFAALTDGKNIVCTRIFDEKSNLMDSDGDKNKNVNLPEKAHTDLHKLQKIQEKSISKCENDILLRRQKRFGVTQPENRISTVTFNGCTVVSRNGKVEERNYPVARYTYDDMSSNFVITEPCFKVESRGPRSIPINFFNTTGSGGHLGPAGRIISYMISEGMIKEAPWANRRNNPN